VTAGLDSDPDGAGRYAGPAREVYRRTLLELARDDERIFCVDSDVGGLEDGFGEELPDRYINVGIAEANLMGISAGLAAFGLLPYANTMSAFATFRACEQLKLDIAANNLPVRVVASHGGLSAGHYGHTHHAAEDLAVLRALPNLTVIVPADGMETASAIRASVDIAGPVFVRLGRAETPPVYTGPYDFTVGRAVPLRDGGDVGVIAVGPLPVVMALRAAETLAGHGVSARVLNMHTVKPLDEEVVLRAARETAGIVTVEDHIAGGGVGGAVCEVTAGAYPCPVRRVGVGPGHGRTVGDERDLLERSGVSVERIVQEAIAVLEGVSARPVSANV
jgi:transketolase